MNVTSSELERVQQSADKLREDLSVLGIHILIIDRYTYMYYRKCFIVC